MMHWSDKYLGKPYAEADCAQLAVLVLDHEFDKRLPLPSERAGNVLSLSEQIANHQGDFAERTDTPKEGDGVLMRARGRLNHVGIYCEINQIGYVLHAMRNVGQTCRHRIDEVEKYNLDIEGFYQWL